MDTDFAVSCPLVRRSRLIPGFCPSTRTFASRFFQTSPRGDSLCVSLALHLHQVGQGTFTPKLLSMPSTQLRRLCRNHMPGYEKTLPCSELIPLYSKAHERALSLQKLHKSRATPGGNPSTGVFELVFKIRAQRQAWNQTANVQAAGADDHEDFLPLVDDRRRAALNRPSKTST